MYSAILAEPVHNQSTPGYSMYSVIQLQFYSLYEKNHAATTMYADNKRTPSNPTTLGTSQSV